MASPSPLSPTKSATTNCGTPTARRMEESPSHWDPRDQHHQGELVPSSPWVSSPLKSPVKDAILDQENPSPSKSRHSRVLSGTELSPLKILAPRDQSPSEARFERQQSSSPFKSPRKFSPARFPVRVNPEVASTTSTTSNTPTTSEDHSVQKKEITIEEAVQQNKDLEHAINIFEDEDSMMLDEEADASVINSPEEEADDEPAGADDTVISTLSTFSAIPSMTTFARLGQTPTHNSTAGMLSSLRGRPEASPSKTTRPSTVRESGNTTNLLIDFTDQLSGFSGQAQQTPRAKPRFSAARYGVSATPNRRQSNLLDFDIPPLPTPRSLPTITPRELESLKSGFLSEISSLKASLSGKDAEVLSLKTAVGDAEKRVGECMEELREIRGVKETLQEEKDTWEKRGREMEKVLRSAKEEIALSQREREEMEAKLDESEKRREASEAMAQDAESKMAGMRAGKAAEEAANKSPEKPKSPGSHQEVEIAVERVARELHALYKSKHETKVVALKKSYENRWEKKIQELKNQIDELAEENEGLRRDLTLTRVDPNQSMHLMADNEERKERSVKDSAQITELRAEVEKLEAIAASIRSDNSELLEKLERERIEKGELVILAEELMSMQANNTTIMQMDEQRPQETPVSSRTAPAPTPRMKTQTTQVANTPSEQRFRSSGAGREPSSAMQPASLRAPGSVKKITKPTHSRVGSVQRSGGGGSQGGLPRPGAGASAGGSSGYGRSGIMSSIEKMGSHRGR